MYNYVGQPRKAQKWIRQVMDELYTDQPAGLCGNEDVGQMSAWYILSALGFYQVEPCGGVYQLGSPIVEEAVIPVGEGKTFTIRAIGNSAENIYVQSATLNGEPLTRSYLNFSEIVAGGTLELTMGNQPSDWATAPEDRP
jgi:putative alpha-1,2-mannosidase